MQPTHINQDPSRICQLKRSFLKKTIQSFLGLSLSSNVLNFLARCFEDPPQALTSLNGPLQLLTFKQYPQLQRDNGFMPFSINGQKITVIRLDKKRAVALSMICTHAGNEIGPYNANTQTFTCPCHHAVFSQTGAVVKSPAFYPLQSYCVAVHQEGLLLDIS